MTGNDPLRLVRYVHGGCASFYAPAAYVPVVCPFCGYSNRPSAIKRCEELVMPNAETGRLIKS